MKAKNGEKVRKISISETTSIKVPGGIEIKIEYAKLPSGGKEFIVTAKKDNTFVRLDKNCLMVNWNCNALRSRKVGYLAENMKINKNSIAVFYDVATKKAHQMKFVRLPKNFKGT